MESEGIRNGRYIGHSLSPGRQHPCLPRARTAIPATTGKLRERTRLLLPALLMGLILMGQLAFAAEVIIDNRDSQTSRTGTWKGSGGAGAWPEAGGDSLYARWSSATFTWKFTPPQPGEYEVYMWWSGGANRATSNKVVVQYGAAQKSTLYVNQSVNAGQWNLLGKYSFPNSGQVTITAVNSSTLNTCADAVKFVSVSGQPTPPTAAFSGSPTTGTAPLTVSFTDQSTGATSWEWDFNNDGIIDSTVKNPSYAYTTAGTYTVKLIASNSAGSDEEIKTNYVTVNSGELTEDIYVAPVLATSFAGYQTVLQDMGATKLNDTTWRYRNTALNKTFLIHNIFDDLGGLRAALQAEGAVVIIHGHANYGIGAAPASYEECVQGYMNDVFYVDDPNLLKVSSPFFEVSVGGMKTHFPNWNPKFADGTSAVMPFIFDDPRGDPPYNYYLSYQIPGDDNYYRIDSIENSPIERMPDAFTGSTWFSIEGRKPNSSDPRHWGYFAKAYPVCQRSGTWKAATTNPGYYGSNYHTLPADPDNLPSNETRWIFYAQTAGPYTVYARWPSSSTNTTRADYEIFHATGPETILANQRLNGGQWNELGTFNFNAGQTYVRLTDNSTDGNVIADGVRVVHTADLATDMVEANFRANTRRGAIPLAVTFTSQSTGQLTSWAWDFNNDGTVDSTAPNPSYTYTASGKYSVKLTVSGPSGQDTTVVTDYISAGVAAPVIQAEFSNSSSTGQCETIPARVSFIDRSTGNPVSWAWDFNNDGTVDSRSQNPIYTFRNPGLYTVKLTVTNANGNTDTKIKERFVRAVTLDTYMDNTSAPSYHFGSSTVLFQKDIDLTRDDMKYSRVFFDICNAGRYYLDNFAHGIVFYSVASSAGRAGPSWMKGYMQGKSDQELWQIIQGIEAKYDYYNFNKRPDQQ